MKPVFRHSLPFFADLVHAGRTDLAVMNAGIDGRFRLAVWLGVRANWSTRNAYRFAYQAYRATRGGDNLLVNIPAPKTR